MDFLNWWKNRPIWKAGFLTTSTSDQEKTYQKALPSTGTHLIILTTMQSAPLWILLCQKYFLNQANENSQIHALLLFPCAVAEPAKTKSSTIEGHDQKISVPNNKKVRKEPASPRPVHVHTPLQPSTVQAFTTTYPISNDGFRQQSVKDFTFSLPKHHRLVLIYPVLSWILMFLFQELGKAIWEWST